MKDNKWLEFKSSVLKLNNNRIHDITNSIGVYDIYKLLRKNKWFDTGVKLTEHQFYTIIREINKFYANALINGKDVNLPCQMGRLELRKYKPTLKYINGKLKNKMPVNWDKTIKLWYEDKESFTKKTLIRDLEKTIYKVIYNKSKAKYNNKTFYQFNINRDIKKGLKNKIKNNEIDAFEL